MNRRSLLKTLFGGAAALTLDPERALWVPGAKLISVPRGNELIDPEWLSREALRILRDNLLVIRAVNEMWDRQATGFMTGHVLNVRKPRALAL